MPTLPRLPTAPRRSARAARAPAAARGHARSARAARAPAGCDLGEVCDGTSPVCPPDAFVASGTVCRASGGICDPAESCTGSSVACPADVRVAAGTVCRAAAGGCDARETCDGTSPVCPPDALRERGFICRALAGRCDEYEGCDGVTAECPPDRYQPAGVRCRDVAGPCDCKAGCWRSRSSSSSCSACGRPPSSPSRSRSRSSPPSPCSTSPGRRSTSFTLGGLALGVGRLVDDSIVELENIHRHLAAGQSRRQAVLAAAQEVAMPIFVSTVTTIVVFFPVLFLAGVARNLFLPLALTVAFALIMSFFVSRTVTPLLCYYVLPMGHRERGGLPGAIERGLHRLDNAYAGALGWVLRHRALTITAILLVFASSFGLLRFIGSEFFPESDESQFSVVMKTPIGTRVERTAQVAARLQGVVERTLAVPGPDGRPRALYNTLIADAGMPAGRGGLFSGNTGPHAGSLNVNLLGKTERPFSDVEALERVRRAIGDAFPGTQLFFSSGGIVKRILNFGSAAPIDVEILGYDLEAGAAFAKRLHERMRGLTDTDGQPLLADVQISREESYPELDVVVDREKAGVLGLTEREIAQTVLGSLVGNTQFAPIPYTDPETGNEYYVNVRLDDADRSKVTDLGDIFVRAPSGAVVSLDTVARIERSSGPVTVSRKYMQRIVDVTANIAPGKDLGRAAAATQHLLDEMPAPEAFTVRLSGQAEAQKAAFSGLGFAALMAIALVYMVLASQFRSLLDPLVIMFAVPLGVTGVFAMLWATGTTLSVNSFMGIIMMVGIVVSNGVLLVDFARVLRERGRPLIEATIEAGRTRLRPILMTTIATITGLAPMALGIGEGSETNLPLARAVIGGLAVSTLFTLFLVPALYTLLDRFSKHRAPEGDEAVRTGAADA